MTLLEQQPEALADRFYRGKLELEILIFLAERAAERALTPTRREIAVALDYPRAEVSAAIASLIEAEYLSDQDYTPRGLQLTLAGHRVIRRSS